MRKVICFFVLMLTLLCAQGHAEVTLQIETDSVSLGQTVLFSVSGTSAEVMYDVYQEGQLLFRSGFTAEKQGAYLPKASGTYRIRATERSTGASAEAVFQVTGPLSVSETASAGTALVGETVHYTASVQGGSKPYRYTFSVLNGNTRFFAQNSNEPSFSYLCEKEGSFTVECTVTDSQGAAASASTALSVARQKQEISVLPDSVGAFPLYGGVRAYTVQATGFWTVECNSDAVTLSRDSGMNGDILYAAVRPGLEAPERAVLTFTCGDSQCVETLSRLTGDGVEREVHLTNVDFRITIDGSPLCVWENAFQTREFAVISTTSWQGFSNVDWIDFIPTADGNLSVTVDDPVSIPRTGYVYICNEESGAYLSVTQSASAQGPVIEDVLLPELSSLDLSEAIPAEVHLSAPADRILVHNGFSPEPLTVSYPNDQIAGNVWLVTVPASQTDALYFAAEKDGVPGPWHRETLVRTQTVTTPAFACEAAEAFLAEDDAVSIKVRVTESVRNIRLINSQEVTTGNVSISSADYVDRYLDADNHGREAEWTFSVPSGSVPAYLQINDTQIPVRLTPKPAEQLPKYNQFDGSWAKVRYRHSDLQTSGCAIFALANALPRLGFTGKEISPAALADKYAFCLVEGGTLNSTLVGNAAKNFGFRTRYDLYDDPEQVRAFFSQGAVFSFSVVKGHIALADSMTDDGIYVHVTDSALSATFSRKGDTPVYIEQDGTFQPVSSPAQIPGAVYYIETDAWSGGEYYLSMDYALKRGLRLILRK